MQEDVDRLTVCCVVNIGIISLVANVLAVWRVLEFFTKAK